MVMRHKRQVKQKDDVAVYPYDSDHMEYLDIEYIKNRLFYVDLEIEKRQKYARKNIPANTYKAEMQLYIDQKKNLEAQLADCPPLPILPPPGPLMKIWGVI